MTLDRFGDRRWSVHSTESFNSPGPGFPWPFPSHTPQSHLPTLFFLNTTTPIISYEQLRARAAARREVPSPPERGQTPVHQEDEMDTDSSPNQGPSSGGDEHNERPHSSVVGTVSEFNHVVAAYNVSPSIVNNAQAFTRVRSLHRSLPCFLTTTHSFDQTYNSSISTSVSKRSGQPLAHLLIPVCLCHLISR